MTADHVITRREGRIGRIILNRPAALNALTLPMIEALTEALNAWRDQPHVHAVVVESASDRAFCAGGDIRSVRSQAIAGDTTQVERFFAAEYALNLAIHDYPKPYVALIDGICMGGGIGVSVHGQVRVASEFGLFAMPETAIGMFPDVGATHFLPRLPGQLGLYLGLTGTRVSGADAVHAGLATHYVPRAALQELRARLPLDGAAVIAEYAQALPPFKLAPQRAAIDRCFSADNLPAIVDRLRQEGSDWAHETLAALRGMSPSALCWTLAAIIRGAELTLPAALAAELKLTRVVTQHPDFAEGVRAMVVDKDRQPNWQPAAIEGIDPSFVDIMFS